MRFRPAWGMTIAALLSLTLLCGLGFWQLQRKVWKEDLIARIAARAEAAPMPFQDALALAAAMPEAERAQIEFRRVRLTGAIIPVKPIAFATLDAEGVQRWLAPVQADGGGLVFLDVRTRGGAKPFAGAAAFDGEGVLRFGKPANAYTPPNDVKSEQWFWPDVQAAAAARNLPAPAPFFLAVETPGGPPNNSAKPVLSDRHLEYAITWFGFALALLGVYLAWHRKTGRLTFPREA